MVAADPNGTGGTCDFPTVHTDPEPLIGVDAAGVETTMTLDREACEVAVDHIGEMNETEVREYKRDRVYETHNHSEDLPDLYEDILDTSMHCHCDSIDAEKPPDYDPYCEDNPEAEECSDYNQDAYVAKTTDGRTQVWVLYCGTFYRWDCDQEHDQRSHSAIHFMYPAESEYEKAWVEGWDRVCFPDDAQGWARDHVHRHGHFDGFTVHGNWDCHFKTWGDSWEWDATCYGEKDKKDKHRCYATADTKSYGDSDGNSWCRHDGGYDWSILAEPPGSWQDIRMETQCVESYEDPRHPRNSGTTR